MSKEYNLAAVKPNVAKQWHPSKNGSLTPEMVLPGTNRKVWWKCPQGEDHEWVQSIAWRSRGTPCPFCTNQRVCSTNNLKIIEPELSKEWNYEKNAPLRPENVLFRSSADVWWKCPRGHEWKAAIYKRRKGAACPICSSPVSRLELRVYTEFKALFNDGAESRKKICGMEADVYLESIKVAIEIDSYFWHKEKYEYDTKKNKVLGENNIAVFRLRDNKLKPILERDILFLFTQECHNDWNLICKLVRQVIPYADTGQKEVLEKYCAGERFINDEEYLKLAFMLPDPMPGRSLQEDNPELAQEWHPTKNGTLTPDKVARFSGKKVWWLCAKGHEWQARVTGRNKSLREREKSMSDDEQSRTKVSARCPKCRRSS